MNFARSPRLQCLISMAFLLAAGCSQQEGPPKPVAIEKAPTSLAEAFKNAKPEAKQLANEVTAAMEAKDYGKALFALQSLSSRSDLTPEQRDIASRSMLAVNQALSEQANSGDQKAQQTLQLKRATK